MSDAATSDQHHKHFEFYVDSKKYETDHASLTGKEIKAQAKVEPTYELYLEVPGDHPDKLIPDGERFDFATHHGVAKFYAIPPAKFG